MWTVLPVVPQNDTCHDVANDLLCACSAPAKAQMRVRSKHRWNTQFEQEGDGKRSATEGVSHNHGPTITLNCSERKYPLPIRQAVLISAPVSLVVISPFPAVVISEIHSCSDKIASRD